MKRLLAIGALFPLLSGCATLLAGGPSSVTVAVDEPRAAEVVVEQLPTRLQIGEGRRELVLTLDRRFDYHALITSPGYRPEAKVIRREIQPQSWGNVAVGLGGGLIGLAAYQASASQGNGLGALFYPTFVSLPAVAIGALGAFTDFATGNMWRHAAPPPARLRPEGERP